MTWLKKIALGMTLIKEGCENNPKWNGCNDCPFGDICDQLFDGAVHWDEALFPNKWELVD